MMIISEKDRQADVAEMSHKNNKGQTALVVCTQITPGGATHRVLVHTPSTVADVSPDFARMLDNESGLPDGWAVADYEAGPDLASCENWLKAGGFTTE